MLKLYLPYGGLRRFKAHSGATIHWFYKGRRAEPVAPYEKLIQSYNQIKGEDKERAEAMADELLTAEEFYLLRAYLYECQNEDVRTTMIIPPINPIRQENERNRGLIRPFGACVEGVGGGFCRLSEEPDYTLPFPVWGYFTEPAR